MDEPPIDELPEAVVQTPGRNRFSWIWLLPLLAAVAGLLLLLRAYLAAGPSITIQFETAEDIEAGKTEVRYKHVVIGTVRSIELAEDGRSVQVQVDLVGEASHVAVEDSEFWVERVRADLGGISGFKTLVTGTYIGVNIGSSKVRRRHFIGLEKPPSITSDQQGRRFVLKASDLGSLNIGSPIYFRRIPVGRIVSFDLDDDGKGVSVGAFVAAPYDRFVTTDARFWNASGIDLSLDAGGFKLDTQSLVTLLAGGVAFQPLSGDVGGAPSAEDASFELHANEQAALNPRDKNVIPVRMRFGESTRGLAVDAPVDFKGVAIGRITAVELAYDNSSAQFVVEVSAEIYPNRLARAQTELPVPLTPAGTLTGMVRDGLRAQLRAGNLLTGQLYVALDFLPGRGKNGAVDTQQLPLQIPTEPGSLDQLQTRLNDIVTKLDRIPFEDIGTRLRDSLAAADTLLRRLDQEVAPAATETLREARKTLDAANRSLLGPEAPVQQDLQQTLQEVDRAARSLRDLSDYLQRHPDALIRGRADEEEDRRNETP